MRTACHPPGLPSALLFLVTRMPLRLLLLLVPILEMYLLIEVGGVIGAVPTILLVILGAVLGVSLLRVQGIATLQRVRRSLAQGEVPALEMLEAAVLLAGGVLFLVPGFLTDVAGLLCLVPVFRRHVVAGLLRRYAGTGIIRNGRRDPRNQPRIIEGDFHKED